MNFYYKSKLCCFFFFLVFFECFLVVVEPSSAGSSSNFSASGAHSISNLENLNEEQWSKKLESLFLFPLNGDQIDIFSSQMKIDERVKADLLLLVKNNQDKNQFGKEEMRLNETLDRTNGKTRPNQNLVNEAELKYKNADRAFNEVAKRFRLELGPAELDFLVWLVEENYIHNKIWQLALNGGLNDKSVVTESLAETIQNDDFFKAYKIKRSSRFSTADSSTDFFNKHEKYLRKRIEYQFFRFEEPAYRKKNQMENYFKMRKSIVREAADIE